MLARIISRCERADRGYDTPCLIWTGATNNHGYGQVRRSGRTLYTHRLAYEATHGPIPPGLELDHLCRVPACCNPAHLEAVTHRENLLRGHGITARAARATHCPQGHPYSGTNLIMRKRGGRECRACNQARDRARYQRSTV